jgi:putative PIN family toxin of toxin-antitoxin system
VADRIVVDTNVLVSAILSKDGAAREVLRLCLTRRVMPLVSNALFLEYEDVFAREEIFTASRLSRADREALLDAFLSVCQWVSIAFLWRPNLQDEGDNHVMELAVAGNATAIVTGNRKDFERPELRFGHIVVQSPAEYLREAT